MPDRHALSHPLHMMTVATGPFFNPNNLYKYAGSHSGSITACMQDIFDCAFERRSVHEKINLHAPENRIETIERDPNMIVMYI